ANRIGDERQPGDPCKQQPEVRRQERSTGPCVQRHGRTCHGRREYYIIYKEMRQLHAPSDSSPLKTKVAGPSRNTSVKCEPCLLKRTARCPHSTRMGIRKAPSSPFAQAMAIATATAPVPQASVS